MDSNFQGFDMHINDVQYFDVCNNAANIFSSNLDTLLDTQARQNFLTCH